MSSWYYMCLILSVAAVLIGLSYRSKQMAVSPGLTVEPLALNITLCQVMVSLSQRQGLRETDGDWLTPLKIFVRDTLGCGVKLNYRHLHMLLGTVWKMVLSQRSKCESDMIVDAFLGRLI